MAEWRTQAQVDADEALHVAIAQSIVAYGNPGEIEGFMLAEYIVITAQAGLSDQKALSTRYDYLLSNGSIPWHNMMGLMAWARLNMDRQMSGETED